MGTKGLEKKDEKEFEEMEKEKWIENRKRSVRKTFDHEKRFTYSIFFVL